MIVFDDDLDGNPDRIEYDKQLITKFYNDNG